MKEFKISLLLFLSAAFFNFSLAQEISLPEEPMASVDIAALYLPGTILSAAQQMPEEYYSFRPTPEVRTFGELLAHIAESNYEMCGIAKGEASESKVGFTKTEVLHALKESFEYCAVTRKNMTNEQKETLINFMGASQTAANVLDFSIFHSLQHYGNVIMYMRLKGLVPPSSQPGSPGSNPVKQVPEEK